MAGRKWTEQEEMLLEGYILGYTIKDTAKLLGRTPNAVRQKLQMLGITGLRKIRNFTPKREDGWTKEEVKILKNSAGKKHPDDIALLINRPKDAIKSKASRLGISLRVKGWSYEDINRCINLRDSGAKWAEVGKALRRTPEACRRKYQYICKEG